MKILIIEDNIELLKDIKEYLEKAGHICETAESYNESYLKLGIHQYDILLVDITLPDGSGLDIIREAKKDNLDVGIIIISAKGAVSDKIMGLDLGADDYIAKPFHFPELYSRLNALYRRKRLSGKDKIEFNEIVIYPLEHKVIVNGKTLDITKKEYDILRFFIINKGRLLTKESIADHLWGDYIENAYSFNFIYTHLANLRKKIYSAGGRDYFKSIYGVGYKFSDEE